MIRAVINIEAPAAIVYNALTDFSRYTAWVPGCERCTVTSQSGNVTDAELVVNGVRRFAMTLRFEAVPMHVLKFRMTRGTELKVYAGAYRLMQAADGGGTVVIAELEVEAGLMVPRFMVANMGRKMMNDTGVALQKYLASTRAGALFGEAGALAAAQTKPRRPKRILQVVKIAEGYRIWLRGETYTVHSRSE